MDHTEQDSFDHPPSIPTAMYIVNTTTYIITRKMCDTIQGEKPDAQSRKDWEVNDLKQHGSC